MDWIEFAIGTWKTRRLKQALVKTDEEASSLLAESIPSLHAHILGAQWQLDKNFLNVEPWFPIRSL